MKPDAVFGFYHNRVFGTDGFYPYRKHGWRAQRAKPFVAYDSTYDAMYNLEFGIQGK